MTVLAEMALSALLAVTAENVLFAGGAGFSRVFRSAENPRSIGADSLLVTLFALISSLCGLWLWPLLPASGAERTAALAASAAVVCAAASFLARFFLPGLYKKLGPRIAGAAVNTVVLSMPYAERLLSSSGFAGAAGMALGTGLSYFLACEAVSKAVALCKNPDMPKAFSGLPAILIYIGILSMAFAGFTGGRIF